MSDLTEVSLAGDLGILKNITPEKDVRFLQLNIYGIVEECYVFGYGK
ncbi:hypothetical protein NG798_21145 [Ancylothrix sp. C2]|nr:hypothetical protein [Ancylothrix sp. D3o]MCT7952307.1 hypothetical protein [Ancylothrix sp. D3o]